MTKGFNKLTKKEQQELEELVKEITEDAKSVVKDYRDNPSEISGSVVSIHENSPFMDETYKDNKWKHVIHGTIEDGIEAVKKVKKNKKNT
jgi:S-adenosylmethionine synthetase